MTISPHVQALVDEACTQQVQRLVADGIPERIALMVVNRAKGVARAAMEGLPQPLADAAMPEKVRHQLALTEQDARHYIASA